VQLEKPSLPLEEILRKKVSSITRNTGKRAEGEKVAEGLVVARIRSNVRGAKEPCYQQIL